MKTTTAIGLMAASLLAGLLIGRALAPEKLFEVRREETATGNVRIEGEATIRRVADVTADAEEKVVTRWRRVVVAEKCEETGERIEVRREERKEAIASDVRLAEKRALAIETRATEHTRTVESPRRWSLGIAGGFDLNGDRHWGGYVRHRLAGPVEVGATVDVPARAGMLTLGVTW